MTCPHCGKGHRNQETVDLCETRAQAREERLQKKALADETRQKQENMVPFRQFIRSKVGIGTQVDRVVGELKRLYPPPGKLDFPERYSKDPQWHHLDVQQVYAQTLSW